MKSKNKQLRCEYGRLYLMKTKDGYEFKCQRCKRIPRWPHVIIGLNDVEKRHNK